jgi:hypothetical protein
MDAQELVLIRFRESVNPKQSFTQQLANALDISYDAAYRRQAGNAKLSVDEAIKLALVGQFSLDNLITVDAPLTALGTATAPINSMEGMERYFKTMHENLSKLGKSNVKLVYSAKDIPVFHHFNDSVLCRFKVFVWLHMLEPVPAVMPFEKFFLPLNIKTTMASVKEITNRFEHVEIWNDTTISSSLRQIHYFYSAGLMTLETALELCADLRALVASLKLKLDDVEQTYDIYHHELLIMTNNSIAFKNDVPVATFITTTMLGYIQFNAPDMLASMELFNKHQLRQATSVKGSNSKDRALFFNKLTQKIHALETALKGITVLDF